MMEQMSYTWFYILALGQDSIYSIPGSSEHANVWRLSGEDFTTTRSYPLQKQSFSES